jgi:hypothetical protein
MLSAGILTAGYWNWALNLGNDGMERAWELATDAAGDHIWVGGEYSQSITVNGITYNAVGLADAYIAKYDSSGNVLWFKTFGSTEEDICLSVAADAAGNCYFTGFYVGDLDYNGQALPSAGLWDIFAGKIDPSGNLLWLKRFGGPLNDIGYGISCDPQGNSYITGWFASSFNLSTDISLQSYGGSDMFVIKLDTNGEPLWAKHGGSEGVEYGYKIDVDSNGTCYATGVAGPGCNFDGLSPTQDGLFIACYNSSGQIQWLSSALNAGPINIAVGPGTGNISRGMVTGRVTGFAIFGNTTLTSVEGSDDIFCAEFDPLDGAWIDVRHWGGTGSDKGRAVDIRGSALVGVSYENGTVIDGIPYSSYGAWDMAVIGENAYPQALTFGGPENDVLGDVKWLSAQSYVVTGWYMGTVRFGSFLLDSGNSTNQNAFVAVFNLGGSHADDPSVPSANVLSCYPNPFSGFLKVESARVNIGNLDVYDIRGRKVKTLQPCCDATQTGTMWNWDGSDIEGKRCANGVYLFRAGYGEAIGKALLIR